MKKLVMLFVCILTVCMLSISSLAQVTFSYKWKAKRADSYCSTTITSIEGAGWGDSYYRIRQVRASSSGSTNGGATYSYSSCGECSKNVSAKDEEEPSGDTFHNTSVYDKYDGWNGMQCYVVYNATVYFTNEI